MVQMALHQRCSRPERLQQHLFVSSGTHRVRVFRDRQLSCQAVTSYKPTVKTAQEWLWGRKAAGTSQQLKDANIRPKKSLGQNYLVNDAILQAIVRSTQVQPGEPVIEIGPGTGNLTRHLLAAGARVTAIEIDAAMVGKLREELGEDENLVIIHRDVLDVNIGELVAEMTGAATGRDGESPQQLHARQAGRVRRVKVVANLPFNITKDCLVMMLPLGDVISHLYFMLQDEVALRLTTQEAGGGDYRSMNIFAQFYSHLKYLFQIDRRSFYPIPLCHGAMVRFVLRSTAERPAVKSEKAFLRMVTMAFAQRRKQLRNTLKEHGAENVSHCLETIGLLPTARAQELKLPQFVDLYQQLEKLAACPAAAAASDAAAAIDAALASDATFVSAAASDTACVPDAALAADVASVCGLASSSAAAADGAAGGFF